MAAVLALLAAAGCSRPALGPEAGVPSTTARTGSPAPPPPAAASPHAAATVFAAAAVIGPDMVAGLSLGATVAEVIVVLGPPSAQEQHTDVSGGTYEALLWNVPPRRGPAGSLVLNFRDRGAEGTAGPRLTDWSTLAPGPRTASGVEVGDAAAKVVAAHGALEVFCCDTHVASVTQGRGHMVVIVDDGTSKVTRIIGGDDTFWSRSIAD